MSFYELVFVVRPDVANTQAEAITKKFTDLIKDKGGKIVTTEQWGLKSLAYRVKKHRKGYYSMIGYEGTGEIVNETERQLRLSDDVIRFLTINVEELSKEPSIQMSQSSRRDEGDDNSEPAAKKSSRPNANPASA